MSICPKCQSELSHDFGLVTCGTCGNVVILDINGDVVQASSELPPPLERTSASVRPPPLSPQPPPQDMNDMFGFASPPPLEPPNQEEDALPDFGVLQTDLPPTPSERALQEEDTFEPIPLETTEEPEFRLPSDIDEEPEPETAAPPPEEGLGLSDYANSTLSQGRDGAYVYNVSISEIDSKEMRDFLREVISDTRFGWDPQQIMGQIKRGELLLKNLSPVKASILIGRLKRLSVKIRWEQYAITQSPNSGAP